MATTLRTCQKYLDARQWRYRVEPQSDGIAVRVKGTTIDSMLIVIHLAEDARYVQFAAPKLIQIDHQIYKGVAFQTLATITHHHKLIRLEYDPADGYLWATIELPLEDAILTQRQFDRCLDTLIHLIDTVVMPRLTAVLATGNDPGQATPTPFNPSNRSRG